MDACPVREQVDGRPGNVRRDNQPVAAPPERQPLDPRPLPVVVNQHEGGEQEEQLTAGMEDGDDRAQQAVDRAAPVGQRVHAHDERDDHQPDEIERDDVLARTRPGPTIGRRCRGSDRAHCATAASGPTLFQVLSPDDLLECMSGACRPTFKKRLNPDVPRNFEWVTRQTLTSRADTAKPIGESAGTSHPARAGTGSSFAVTRDAARAALARPVRPVVHTASASTTAPQATMIHQPGLVAAAKPVRIDPCRFAASTDPMIATPSEAPTCRDVDAIPEATPACDRGMPDTALFVIGAFTQPMPIPSTRPLSSTYHAADESDRRVNISPPAISPIPAMTSGIREP